MKVDLNKKTISIIESAMAYILYSLDKDNMDYEIAVPSDDRWGDDIEIPPGQDNGFMKIMKIGISGWTKEQSYYDKKTGNLHIVTAFGDVETEAVFKSSEILGIFDDNSNILLQKTYYITNKKKEIKEKTNYTMRGLMSDPEPDDISMNSMLKNNPKLFKPKKEDDS